MEEERRQKIKQEEKQIKNKKYSYQTLDEEYQRKVVFPEIETRERQAQQKRESQKVALK